VVFFFFFNDTASNPQEIPVGNVVLAENYDEIVFSNVSPFLEEILK